MEKNRKPISRIGYLRERVGLTQLELSRLVNVTENTIQNWEKGRSSLEHIERVIRLCQALNCSPADLIEYETVLPIEGQTARSGKTLNQVRQSLGTDTPAIQGSHHPKRRSTTDGVVD
jgi:transcriptional regulator with XRE-family HTH domain